MKVRNLLFAAASSVFLLVSCKDNQSKNDISVQDTAGLAAYNQQKLLDAQMADQQAKIDSLAQIKAAEINAAKAAGPMALAATSSSGSSKSTRSSSSSRHSSSSSSSSGSSRNTSYDNGSSSGRSSSSDDDYASAPAETSTQKRGISKAAKGAMIGAGTGAVAGAIINKRKPGVGAVVGGVVGGAAGYGIGRSKDKKDGRY